MTDTTMVDADADIVLALTSLTTPSLLSIHALAEPILSTPHNDRSSIDHHESNPITNPIANTNTLLNPPNSNPHETSSVLSPSTLQADLTHYKSLFSKLRFSYTEQVTKERFLKSLTASDPTALQPIDQSTLSSLTTTLAADKAALQTRKAAVSDLLFALEGKARDATRRFETVESNTARLALIPGQTAELESRISAARANAPLRDPKPEMNLSLAETGEVLSEREAEAHALDERIRELEEAVRKRADEVGILKGEVVGLEERKRGAVEEARKMVKRRKGMGGAGAGAGAVDEVELRGRWLRGSEAALRGWLEV